jgi:hypothetical protein
MFVTLIKGKANLGPRFLPDISAGQHWSRHWMAENLDNVYGQRRRYDHNYPSYFPQSASNPQNPYCYPDEALGEFRRWVRQHYIAKKMPNYLGQKIKAGEIPPASARAAIKAFAKSSGAPALTPPAASTPSTSG